MRVFKDSFLTHRWLWIGISLSLTIGMFIASSFAWYWYSDYRASAARQASLDLTWIEQSIINKLETHQSILQNWAQDLQVHSSTSNQEFLSRIDGLIKENHAILAVEFLDEQYRALTGLPGYQQRPSYLPPLSDPFVTEALNESQILKLPSYSKVIEQFAPLWVLALPISSDHHPKASIIVIYDLDKLLTQEIPWWFVQRYNLSLVDSNDKQLSPSEAGLIVHPKEMTRLNFGSINSGLILKTSVRAESSNDTLIAGTATAAGLFGVMIIWLLRVIRRWLLERQRARQALRERDELLQHTARLSNLAEFASGIAHELNQPLAAIANYSAAAECFLNSEQPQWEKIKEAILRTGEESRRAGKIMHSMRAFIQKTITSHESCSLPALLIESMSLVEAQARRQNIRLSSEIEVEELIIACDPIMLKQVLFNLLRNALEAMTSDVQQERIQDAGIRCRLQQNDDHVIISITDQGHGIADISQLFQSFYTTKKEGMGLGLAICRTVIENHGGKIWAENNPQGGASFHFRLPCNQADQPLHYPPLTQETQPS